jgi:hypothetical protein
MPYTTINKGSSYFNTVTYTGTGSTINLNTVGFQPNLTWIKGRNFAFDHALFDSVRGGTKQLYSNLTNAEFTWTNGITFDSEGVDISADSNLFNGSTYTYASWHWLGGGTGVSNTSGSISSTVSANTTSGFSIVSYTGTGANATVGHGLGVAPRMIILKSRTDSGADWRVYHASVGNTGYLELNTTGATTTSSTTWQNTTPTSTVFSIGTSGTVNLNTGNFIAYCFAEIKGFSKFSSYTGNGSADGTFIYTGFKPAYVGFKKSSAAGTNWVTSNNKVNTYNAVDAYLHQNSSGSESTGSRDIDFLSNGFKIRNSNSTWNESGATFIYMAFAENPFVSSTLIPTTAR